MLVALLLYGYLRKVRSEFALVCTGHNLLKWWLHRTGERVSRAQGP